MTTFKNAMLSFLLALTYLLAAATACAAVRLPACTAPTYDGEASLKELKDPIALPYHRVLLENEARGGKIAYCLSRSGMEQSGLSFGVSQLDLRTNPKVAWPVLEAILKDGPYALSNQDREYLKAKLVGNGAALAKDLLKADDPKLDRLLGHVNLALNDRAGRDRVNEAHIEHVRSKAAFLRTKMVELQTSAVGSHELLVGSMTAQLLLMDFVNLYGHIDDQLVPFLKTGFLQKKDGSLKLLSDKFVVSDIIRFALQTLQANKCTGDGRAEILRRIGNVLVVAKNSGDQTKWSTSDKRYFAQTLPAILAEQCVAKNVDLTHLKNFVRHTFAKR